MGLCLSVNALINMNRLETRLWRVLEKGFASRIQFNPQTSSVEGFSLGCACMVENCFVP